MSSTQARLALRIHDGAFSAMDLTARRPCTGELLSIVKFMVQTLAAAGDLQRELTYGGLRAVKTKGSKGGRRPAIAADAADAVRTEYLEGRSIAALARDHGVSRGAIRTAVADLLPDRTATEEDAPAPELPVTLDMPGKVADVLRTTGLEPAERAALGQGATVRRGQGYTLRVTTVPAVHRQFLDRCQPLDGAQGAPAIPAQRKAPAASTRTASTLSWPTTCAESDPGGMARRRYCHVYGAVLPKTATRRRLYCGPACRAQAYRDRQRTERIGALGQLLKVTATDNDRLLRRLLCPACGCMTYAAGSRRRDAKYCSACCRDRAYLRRHRQYGDVKASAIRARTDAYDALTSHNTRHCAEAPQARATPKPTHGLLWPGRDHDRSHRRLFAPWVRDRMPGPTTQTPSPAGPP